MRISVGLALFVTVVINQSSGNEYYKAMTGSYYSQPKIRRHYRMGMDIMFGHGGYKSPSYVPPPYQSQTYAPPPSYQQQQPYSPPSYGYSPPSYGQSSPSYSPPSYGKTPQSYGYSPPSYYPQPTYPPPTYKSEPSYAPSSYDHGSTHSSDGYGQSSYDHGHEHSSYDDPIHYEIAQKKEVVKKVYVPLVIRKKKQKKKKTIAEYHGFFIPGGTQLFGKFKDMKSCKKACEITPNCFAGDYNPWLKKCYIHTNTTACSQLRAHKKIKHYKKIPCDLVESERGLIVPGAQLFGGIEQKGVKSLSDCIKKCATAGGGVAPAPTSIATTPQLCFGVDYDFGSHKCYFIVDRTVCPDMDPVVVNVNLVPNPAVLHVLICPRTTV